MTALKASAFQVSERYLGKKGARRAATPPGPRRMGEGGALSAGHGLTSMDELLPIFACLLVEVLALGRLEHPSAISAVWQDLGLDAQRERQVNVYENCLMFLTKVDVSDKDKQRYAADNDND